jgi:DNA mismatch repair protein MutS2
MNKLYLEANPVIEQEDDGYVLPRALVKGDRVLVWDTKRNGIVITPPDNKGYCFVQIGVMKSKVEVSKLRLVEKQKPVKAYKSNRASGVSTKGVESRMTRKASTELDIRGYAADDERVSVKGIGSAT